MRIIKKSAIIFVLLVIFVASLYLFLVFPKYTVPILIYHDFGYSGGIQVVPEAFERHMRYINDRRYKVISLDELVEGIKKRSRFSHNTVVITMDDGYKDNFIYAYPILKRYGFPATIFLIVNNIESDENFLNWEQVIDMSKNKITFGGHTKNHIYLPKMKNRDILWDEIYGCKKVIEEHIGKPVGYFSYPEAGFTEKVKTLVKKAGYKAACTTNRGFDKTNRVDLYELKRISVRNSENSFSLWAKLSGYYNIFRKRREGD